MGRVTLTECQSTSPGRFDLKDSAAKKVRLARRAVARSLSVAAEIAFDRRMGVRTRGILHNEAGLAPSSIGGDPVHYEGTHLLLWWRLHAAIPTEPGSTTFVDLGAGLGRAVILAAEKGYRRVIGVELDEQLVQEAGENIHRWQFHRRGARRPGQEVVIVHGDAATYEVPAGPLVICVYNSFGPSTLRHVLRRASERGSSLTDELVVAYLNPVHVSVFDEFPEFTVHRRGKRWVVYRLAPGGVA